MTAVQNAAVCGDSGQETGLHCQGSAQRRRRPEAILEGLTVTVKAQRFDVVISGASFAGLALACGLTRALGDGVRVAIIDRAAAAAPMTLDGRAFAIWAGAQAVLDSLGVWSAIAPGAQEMTSIEITDSALDDGVRQSRVTYDAKTSDGRAAAHMVPAALLHRALYQAIEGTSAITWLAPAEAIDLKLGDITADVVLSDGHSVAGSLAVAADGRQSTLRERAGIKTVGWGYDQVGLVATVALELPHNGVAIQHFLPGGPFAVLPLRNNRACITWSAATADANRMIALSDAAFVAELEHRIGGRFGALTLAGPRQSWPLNLKIPRALTTRRFALMGDAAHGVHPVAGQGVNLALRDAAALVECLVDAARLGFDLGHGPALERYERWRRFDSTMSATLYDGLNRVFRIDNVVLRAGRGAALGLVDRSDGLKQLIMSEASGMTGELPKLARGLPV